MCSAGHNYTVTGIQEDHLDNEPLAENGKAPFHNYCKFPHNFKIVCIPQFFSPNTSDLILDFLFNIVYLAL